MLKYVVLILISGCTEHYNVMKFEGERCLSKQPIVWFECKHQKRMSMFDDTLRICEQFKDCNEYCEQKRDGQ